MFELLPDIPEERGADMIKDRVEAISESLDELAYDDRLIILQRVIDAVGPAALSDTAPRDWLNNEWGDQS